MIVHDPVELAWLEAGFLVACSALLLGLCCECVWQPGLMSEWTLWFRVMRPTYPFAFSFDALSMWYSSLAGASGSDDVDTDWDREFFGTGKTGENSPNDVRDVTRANIAKGFKGLLGAAQPTTSDSKTGPG